MALILKLILSFLEKKENNNIIYLKGIPIVGDMKIVCEEVGEDRPKCGKPNAVDVFMAYKKGILRISVIPE